MGDRMKKGMKVNRFLMLAVLMMVGMLMMTSCGKKNEEEVTSKEDTVDVDGDNIPEQIETSEKTIIPEKFEDVLEFSDSFDGMSGVENVLKWDVSDVFSNYFFAGAYMKIGGETGEEKNVDIVNEKSLMAMQYFKNMK